jgi:putative SOS response-associated peptidase YedK
MPVILHPHDQEQWVDASQTRLAKARSLLKPYPEELKDAHDVSPTVNSAKYDGPECIQPVSDETYRALGSCPCGKHNRDDD